MTNLMEKLDVHLNRIMNAILALIFLFALVGCGYHFKGMGLTAPVGVRTIAITVLDNRTSESRIETVFTSDIIYEFTRSKVLRVVGKDTADAVLSGTIMSLSEETIAYTASYDSAGRRVTITLNMALERADGNVIWSDRALSDKEAFKVDPSHKLATEKNKRVAIEAISDRLAEKIHNRILQGF